MYNYRFTKPINMPRGMHYGNNYWIFQSRKLGRRVTAFSNLEYENLITLEMNSEVEYYCEQPLKISIFENGEEKCAIPDVWVLYRDGREELQEVKYNSSLSKDDSSVARNLEQIRREKMWCEENNISFVIKTETEIHRGEYYLQNLVFLYGHLKANEEWCKTISDEICSIIKPSSNLGKIISFGMMPANNIIDVLSYMYFKGIISFDDIQNKVLTLETEVNISEKEQSDL